MRRRCGSRVPRASEDDADGEMQSYAVCFLAIGDIDPKRSDRRLDACAEAVSEWRRQATGSVGSVARIDEGGDPPIASNPAHHLRARDGVVATADGGVAFLWPERVQRITSDSVVAASSKK